MSARRLLTFSKIRSSLCRTLSAILLALCLQLQLSAQNGEIKFAVIGDFGSGDNNERDVANLVKSWSPDFVLTVGDNNYPNGEASTIDENIGQFYHEFIYPYTGTYGAGATVNRFFPSLGNHDWDNNTGAPAQPYLNYFTLPGNERYYDFVRGPVHFFALDSDSREPDGRSSNSVQANWLRAKLAASTARWKVVYFHHTPYSSRTSSTEMQWQFQQWGSSAVIAGHAHIYERVMKNGFPYMTNGLGGESTGSFGTPIEGSVVRYGNDYGAQLVTASDTAINFKFVTRTGVVIDSYTISTQPLGAPGSPAALAVSASQINLSWTDNSTSEDGFKIERCQNANCTNFAEIADAPANATGYIDSGLTADTTYVYRLRAYNSTGNSAYSSTAQAKTNGAGTVLFTDDFNDGVRDASKWNIGILSRSASNFDPVIPVAEQNGRLAIAPRANYSTAAYSGYVSAASVDFADSNAAVELVQKAAGSAATIFSVGIDKDNWYGFRAKGSTLYLESRINAATTSASFTFDAVQHRFWRLRHDAPADTIVFETAPDAVNWTARRVVARQFALAQVKTELIAGTGEAVAAPGTALFDNFSYSSNTPPLPPPAAPSGLTAAAVSSSRIDLAWTDNAADEDGFKIERCQNASCTNFAEIAQVAANAVSYSNEGLSAVTTYRYRVRAFKAGTNSAYSNIAQVETPLPPPEPPEEPSNLTATGISTSAIRLHWSVNSANEDGFKIERCQNAGCTNFAQIAEVGIDVEEYTDSQLPENTTFLYRVKAFNEIGDSPYSNTAQGATLAAAPPAAPDSLTATATSPTKIDLLWADNSANEAGFRIERCQNAGCTDFAEIAQTPANTEFYGDAAVTASTTYRYRVTAFNVYGASAYSNTVEAATPAVPVAVFADDFNDNVRDPSKWSIGLLSRSSSQFDAQVGVAETNGQLRITPRTADNGNSYSGYVSVVGWTLTNASAAVELVQKAAGSAATIFSVGIDKNNWYGFRAKGSTLYLESRINSSTTSVTLTYDAVQHRFWRLRHDPATDSILFETAPDAVNWTTRRTIGRQLSLSTVKFELIGGTTGSEAAPGAALFDNFTLTTN